MEKDICTTAKEIVDKRQAHYGRLDESFEEIARIASITTKKHLTKEDIVKVQQAIKLVRESNGHKRDNLVDLVGYTYILDEMNKRK